MNKLKNLGISALAGTLVSLSAAQAGGISVTGSWELSYTQLDHDEGAGNKIGMNKNLGFGAWVFEQWYELAAFRFYPASVRCRL